MKQSKDNKNVFQYIANNETSRELLIGNMIFYIIGQIIILVLCNEKMYTTIGFTEGVVISFAMIVHMSVSLEKAMFLNEKGAFVYIRKTAAIRLFFVIVALVLIGLTGFGNIVATLFGIMALKVSAYLQPFTHKVLAKKSTGKGG